jgi:hypothetical protein
MRLDTLADQSLFFVTHHPMATVAIAAAVGVLSWLFTRSSTA